MILKLLPAARFTTPRVACDFPQQTLKGFFYNSLAISPHVCLAIVVWVTCKWKDAMMEIMWMEIFPTKKEYYLFDQWLLLLNNGYTQNLFSSIFSLDVDWWLREAMLTYGWGEIVVREFYYYSLLKQYEMMKYATMFEFMNGRQSFLYSKKAIFGMASRLFVNLNL